MKTVKLPVGGGIHKFTAPNRVTAYQIHPNTSLFFIKNDNMMLRKVDKPLLKTFKYQKTYQYSGCVVLFFRSGNDGVVSIPIPIKVYVDFNALQAYFNWLYNVNNLSREYVYNKAEKVMLMSTVGSQLDERDTFIYIFKRIFCISPWFKYKPIKEDYDEFMRFLNETTLELERSWKTNRPFDKFTFSN